MGVIERVDEKSGPKSWVSNLVVVPKDDERKRPSIESSKQSSREPKEIEVRLTCDSRLLNKALKRKRYPIKTIEDKMYLMNGATKFSKLDIWKAFH